MIKTHAKVVTTLGNGHRKCLNPHNGCSLEVTKKKGFSKAKVCKGKYEAEQEPEPSVREVQGMNIFWGNTTTI